MVCALIFNQLLNINQLKVIASKEPLRATSLFSYDAKVEGDGKGEVAEIEQT